jgi:hypothetical protein
MTYNFTPPPLPQPPNPPSRTMTLQKNAFPRLKKMAEQWTGEAS